MHAELRACTALDAKLSQHIDQLEDGLEVCPEPVQVQAVDWSGHGLYQDGDVTGLYLYQKQMKFVNRSQNACCAFCVGGAGCTGVSHS